MRIADEVLAIAQGYLRSGVALCSDISIGVILERSVAWDVYNIGHHYVGSCSSQETLNLSRPPMLHLNGLTRCLSGF